MSQAFKIAATIMPNVKSSHLRQRAAFYSFLDVLMQLKDAGHDVKALTRNETHWLANCSQDSGFGVDQVSEWSNRTK